MLPYTGDYIEHINDNKSNSKYYAFRKEWKEAILNGTMFVLWKTN